MPSMMRILVPTDFSPCAAEALEHAIAMAKRLGATIDLLYVWEGHATAIPQQFDRLSSHTSECVAEFAATRDGRTMERLLRSLRKRGVAVRGVIEPGPIVEAIVRLAVRDGHDLIVMGRHGRTGMAAAIRGGVTTAVLALAPCPVFSYQSHEMEAVAA
jgi:nucleotide-binding universal stress UspA family protein